jgi:hypothetical protein
MQLDDINQSAPISAANVRGRLPDRQIQQEDEAKKRLSNSRFARNDGRNLEQPLQDLSDTCMMGPVLFAQGH